MEQNKIPQACLSTSIGLLKITVDDQFVKGVEFTAGVEERIPAGLPLLNETVAQIEAYFSGRLQNFDLPLAPQGTDFQQRVWQALRQIPFGKTASYQDIARAVGNPKAVRAVGGANHHNPIAIIIPCHRVIGADGKLTGYGGGLWRKEWLLRHEGSWPEEGH